jgi:hypothetical protein
MADSLDERKARLLAAARRDPEGLRRTLAGAGFAFQLARAVLGAREPVAASVLRAPDPPPFCPTCSHPALNPVRDPNGDWTWACVEGCNP